MRGAESSLYGHRVEDLARLRDDDVTGLEIRVAVLGALMLLAVAVATGMARTPHPPAVRAAQGLGTAGGGREPRGRGAGRLHRPQRRVRPGRPLRQRPAPARRRPPRARRHPGVRPQAPRAASASGWPTPARNCAPNSTVLRRPAGRPAAQHQRHLRQPRPAHPRPGRAPTRRHRGPGGARAGPRPARPRSSSSTTSPPSCAGTARTCWSSPARSTSSSTRAPSRWSTWSARRSARSSATSASRIPALPPHAQVAGFAADDLSHLVAELLENATAFSPPDARRGLRLAAGER